MWNLYRQAKEWHCRPSNLLGLSGPEAVANGSDDIYAAYCLDEAAFIWGNFVESKVAEATEDSKNPKMRQMRVDSVFRNLFAEEHKTTKGKYKDPAVLFGKGGVVVMADE